MPTTPTTKPALPEGAIGFIGRSKQRPERLSLFLADAETKGGFKYGGAYAMDATIADVAPAFARQGYRLDAAGFVFPAKEG